MMPNPFDVAMLIILAMFSLLMVGGMRLLSW